jgi:hypothetical protein
MFAEATLSRLAKILIMCVRLIALLSIILGIILFLGHKANPQNYIASHFAFGFLLAACVFLLGVVAMTLKMIPLGTLGVLAAIALPITGFKQIATIGPHMGGAQVGHIIVVLAALGIAEATAGKIKRAA